MPDGNPLVAQAQSTTTGYTGIGIAESAVDLASGISDGSWVAVGLGAVGVGLEVLSMVVDPIGTLASYGVSWLIEHVQPLKEALDWLAGDPPVIQSFSETWANVAAEVSAVAGDLGNEVNTGTAGWSGEAADAYRQASAEQADAIAGAATLSEGISVGVMIMGEVVAAVREIVRDLVAELVGKLITWALEAAGTLGFATPLIAVQATTAISKAISKISDLIRKLVKTIGNVSPLIRRVIDKLDEIIQALAKLARKFSPGGGTTPSSTPNTPGIDAPTVKSPDATTPSSATTTPSGTTTPDAPSTTPKSPDTTSPSSTSPDGPGTTTPNGGKPDGTSPNGGKPDGSIRDNVDPRADGRLNDWKCTDGDPIDLATGEMIMGEVDVELPGVLPLILRRAHHSGYRVGRSFGRTWTSTLDQRLEVDQHGVCYAASDGVLLTYPTPPESGGAVLPAEGPRWPLWRTSDGGYAVRHKDSGHVHYFPAGRYCPLAAVVDRNDNRIDFEHDEDGLVKEVRHSGGYRVAVDRTAGLVTGLRLLTGEVTGVSLVQYRYDSAGRLSEVLNSSGLSQRFDYDHMGRVTRWENRNGEWYAYYYDERGRCVRTEGSGGVLTCSVNYDDVNRITTYTDSRGYATRYHFNENWQLIREISPLGHIGSFEWDRYGALLSRTDPLGRTWRYVYDRDGNMTAVIRPDGGQALSDYNEFGQPVRIVDPDGATWLYSYDQNGNHTSIVDPTGATTRFGHGDRGQVVSTTDAMGNTHRVLADAAGLALVVTDPLGATVQYERDAFGRVVAITDPVGGVTRLRWTVEGKLLSRTTPDGASEHWRYDGEGNQIEHVDPLGGVTRTRITHFDFPAERAAPDGAKFSYSYDTELHLVSITNPQGLVWRYTYDAEGRLEQETDFNGRTLTYKHDAAGQLLERINGAGQVVRFARDAMGNVTRREVDGDITVFSYDPADRVLRATNSAADIVYRRDRLGRPVEETVNGRTLALSFDALGRKVRRRTPSGSESYWSYDANSRPSVLRSGDHVLRFGYDASGRETTRMLGQDVVLSQSWDPNDRLLTQALAAGPAGHFDGAAPRRTVQSRSFHYRQDGYVQRIEDQDAGLWQLALDRTGRVNTVHGPRSMERYAYDPAGKIASAEMPSAQPGDREVRSYAGTLIRTAGRVSYQHDSQGRTVLRSSRSLSGKVRTWHYRWDGDDRLTEVTTPDGWIWQYKYDPFGRRIAKLRQRPHDRSVVERVAFSWEGTHLAEQLEETTGRATTWDWGANTGRPLTQTERALRPGTQDWYDSRFYSIITDLIGAPTELVDPSGSVAWRSSATLWGESVVSAGGVGTPLRFPGQYYDDETGLHYNYFRYYDPHSGRYQSADPLGFLGGPDPHGYVGNPRLNADPLGLTGYGCGLTRVGPNTYESPAGLRYNPDSSPNFDDRFAHVMNHANDIPNRPQHGVFADPNPNSVGRVVDEAYLRVQNGEAFSVPQGNRMVHFVNMQEDIGFMGGVNGGQAGNPAVRYMQLVLENGNEVITAFPVSGIPSKVLG
ncbi:RHS repeat-associated core domain-containing protein [Amycolatopsis marina]|uniref:RHS repeat-associated core domain-containing protein n=1 Tax=Amycolatopsis marina TaxID=490629 RepID=A0A1I1CGK9_9PSEU|nr:DUF6531 domain-containing protein [Amycolatopsis marina]SFB61831.1 RHS repeat-associated core domain-containing protein [Amycolatopsis marina]